MPELCPYCREKVASVALHVFTCTEANPPEAFQEVIYLCGAISGLRREHSHDWRYKASHKLEGHYGILNPLRREWRKDDPESIKALIEGDKADVLASDIILVDGRRPSWGSGMEFHLASSAGKDILVFTDPAPYDELSIWVSFHASRIFAGLDAAIAHLIERADRRRLKGGADVPQD